MWEFVAGAHDVMRPQTDACPRRLLGTRRCQCETLDLLLCQTSAPRPPHVDAELMTFHYGKLFKRDLMAMHS